MYVANATKIRYNENAEFNFGVIIMTDKLLQKYPESILHSSLFAEMDSSVLESALDIMNARPEKYIRGDTVHRSFEKMKSFGLVLEGRLQAVCDDIDGNRMILANVTPGRTFGEALCFLGKSDSPVYICAAEDSSVLWLSAGKIYQNSGDSLCAELRNRFTALLAQRTLEMNNRIQVLSKIRLRDKLVTFFSEYKASHGRNFTVPFSREDMASYLGTDRSALSRELSNMKSEGLIDYYRNSFRIIERGVRI